MMKSTQSSSTLSPEQLPAKVTSPPLEKLYSQKELKKKTAVCGGEGGGKQGERHASAGNEKLLLLLFFFCYLPASRTRDRSPAKTKWDDYVSTPSAF